jgi:hypothetical protein
MKKAIAKSPKCNLKGNISRVKGCVCRIERLRDPPTEWSRRFEALGLNSE